MKIIQTNHESKVEQEIQNQAELEEVNDKDLDQPQSRKKMKWTKEENR